MNIILEQIHSFFAYAFLTFSILSFGYALVNLITKDKFNNTQFGLAKYAFISGHCQILIGLVIWFRMGFLTQLQTNAKELLSNPQVRLLAIEHPVINIIGIVLISFGFIHMKKADTDRTKHLRILVFYGIATALIMSRIPWHLWID